MARLLNMGPSPHIRTSETVERVMYDVIIALIPAFLVALYIFGIRALVITLISVITCMLTEFVCSKVMKKEPTILDGSAIITGILFAFVIPVSMPLYIVVVGAFVSIFLGKMVFGGLGNNIFNPALVGRAFVQASWAPAITTFFYHAFRYNNAATGLTVDTAAGATVLSVMKAGRPMHDAFMSTGFPLLNVQGYPIMQAFLGRMSGCIGEVSALAILIGGLYLIYRKQIDWKVPVITIGVVFILTWIMGGNPLMHIFSGGLFLGAFFMATDMVTSPVTDKGRIICAAGLGFLIALIRMKGGFPEGTMYAILIMNGLTPLINRFTETKKFGGVKANEK